jgi:large subunit ribosomal protein L30
MLRIKLVRSTIAQNPRNIATVQALGLKKIGSIVEKEDNPSIRGMIHKIQHMVVVEVPEGAEPIVDASHPGSSSRMIGKHQRNSLKSVAPKAAASSKKVASKKAPAEKVSAKKVTPAEPVAKKAPTKSAKKKEGE